MLKDVLIHLLAPEGSCCHRTAGSQIKQYFFSYYKMDVMKCVRIDFIDIITEHPVAKNSSHHDLCWLLAVLEPQTPNRYYGKLLSVLIVLPQKNCKNKQNITNSKPSDRKVFRVIRLAPTHWQKCTFWFLTQRKLNST